MTKKYADDNKDDETGERGPWRSASPSGFSSGERDRIIGILSNPNVGYGTRAGYLLRKCPRLKFTRPAKLLYVLLAGFLGVDSKLEKNTVRVPLKVLAGWLGCTPRTVQTLVRELVRSGPLPLLTATPGRPGRASQYTFVENPFAVAAAQAEETERAHRFRQPRLVTMQAAIMVATEAGTIGSEEAGRRHQEAYKRKNWNTTTRAK